MKGVVGFIFGAAAGSVATYFITKAVVKKKYEAWANEQINEVVSHYKNTKKEEPPRKAPDLKKEEVIDTMKQASSIDLAGKPEDGEYARKGAMYNKGTMEEIKVADPSGDYIIDKFTEKDTMEPHEISGLTFNDPDRDDYGKLELNYFMDDQILCDEDGNVLDDQEITDLFGEGFKKVCQTAEFFPLYWTNPVKKQDFEILIEDGAYTDSPLCKYAGK